jgi:hypothetical protein
MDAGSLEPLILIAYLVLEIFKNRNTVVERVISTVGGRRF